MALNPSTSVDYNGQINAPDASYPYGSARDDSVPGDLTGTPRVASEIKDTQGLYQKLLNEAGIVPSGVPDSVVTSQYFQALAYVFKRSVPTITDLRLKEGNKNGETIGVLGYTAAGDGGGGPIRYWKTGSGQIDNGGSIIVPGGGIGDPSTTGAWVVETLSPYCATWFGAKADGSTASSSAIQRMLAAANGRKCVIPYTDTGVYIIEALDSESCLKPPANTDLLIHHGVILKAASGIGASVRLIFPVGDNVKISAYGATLTGIKSEYTTGEDRHGIIAARTGFVLEGLIIKDTGGDGIYIGDTAQNVTLRDVITDNVRRNGLSIIACTNFHATNCQFNNSNGIAPQMGVDVEPNNNAYDLSNIKFYGCSTNGNASYGFNVSLAAIKGVNDRIADISFIDCTDTGSENGFGCQELFLDSNNVNGEINFIRCKSINAGLSGFSFRNYDADGPFINVERPVVIDSNQDASTVFRYAAPISVWQESADTGAAAIGGVRIFEPTIKNTGTPQAIPDFYFAAPGAATLSNVHLVDPLELSQTTQTLYMNFEGAGTVSDKYRKMVFNGTSTINGEGLASIYQNTGAVTYSLSTAAVGFPELVFEVTDQNDYLTVDPDETSFILPGGGAGKYIRALDIGARLRIRRYSATQWVITEQIGTWTFEV